MKMRRFIASLAAILTLALLENSCDVHEFPQVPESRPHVIRFKHETDLPIWNLDYTLQGGVTSKGEVLTKSVMKDGQMRYIIRTYNKDTKARSMYNHIQEFVFTRDIEDGYDCEFEVDIIPGEYQIMVWADMTEFNGVTPYYNTEDFAGITLLGKHVGTTDYKDAFRGYADVAIESSINDIEPDTTDVAMERPLAKFEFLSTDLKEFIANEQTKADIKSKFESKGEDVKSTKVTLNDYNVVFHYPGFMPNKFSMFTDKAVDSATGISFPSSITQVNDDVASVGFDYIFVNHKQASVSVQIGIYNKEGVQLSLSNPIEVPLKRSYHSILKGTFLTQRTSGGITINPDFDGDYNITIQ